MSNSRDSLRRRSFLSGTAAVGCGLLSGRARGSQESTKLLEIVSTEEAELYYEFVVRGAVEKATVDDKIGSTGDNDVIITGNNEATQVVRGYTGNPGYGDAYRIDGELVFFEQTGGTSDFFVRLDGARIPHDDLPRQGDPTMPGRPTYIEREIDGVLGIRTPDYGELYYELVVQGDVEGGKLSDAVSATFGMNDARSTDGDTGATIIRGFTGNPGYGDAYAIDGEVVSFRRDGGDVDFVFLLDGQELTLAELANSGTGYPTYPANEDPVTGFRAAMDALDVLAERPGDPTERRWYNQAIGQARRARTAIDTLAEQGYRFQLETGVDLTIRLVAPDGTPSEALHAGAFGTGVRPTRDTSAPILLTGVSVPALILLGAIVPTIWYGSQLAASFAARATALMMNMGRLRTASDVVTLLYSNPVLVLSTSTSLYNRAVQKEMFCHVAGNVAKVIEDDPALHAAAKTVSMLVDGCSLGVGDLVEIGEEALLAALDGEDPTVSNFEVVESVICGGIENEWHLSGHEHTHTHGYVDERYEFSRTTDDRVYMWVHAKNVPARQYTFTWVVPDRQDYSVSGTIPTPADGQQWDTRRIWHGINLSSLVERGDWRAEFHFDGEQLAEEAFQIQE